ncbi:SIR2 family NAD-dependent protein deacylase [Euzebya tangerina]|uniref:SIR2 family NAD-dependent protein deacylase n=1 Tax=Euzebya tangerina TaxID=591198 RepID=UPI00196B859E|nr:Sir2 family NAD-dependent protein deacetylase [Euzebya tangerina]
MVTEEDLGAWLAEHQSVVVFTGAGISTESGIPDFRSPGGVWTKYDPRELTFQRYVASADVRARSWKMRREFFAAGAKPNPAHEAVARWERDGRSPGVITQNIDGLHAAAGSRSVARLHGTAAEVMCVGAAPVGGQPVGCGWREDTRWAFDAIDAGTADPMCPSCGGLIKSATVSFGQMMFPEPIELAEQMIEEADAMLVIGSSLSVYPAAGFPEIAAARGMGLGIINAEPTPLDHLADVVVHGRAGEILAGR